MSFCANCGGTVPQGTAFCARCGKSVGVGPHAVAVAQGAGVAGQALATQPVSAALTSNLAAALAYILGFITGIIFLVIEPYKRDRFVRFHAMQSVLYSAAGIIFRIGWHILVGALMSVTPWAAMVLVPLGMVIALGLFLFWLFLMYQAYSNREFRIPILGGIAQRQAG